MKKNARWEWVAAYFTFSARERWAVIALVVFIFLFFIAPGWLPETGSQVAVLDSIAEKQIEGWKADSNEKEFAKTNKAGGLTYYHSENENIGERFYFDPNTASREDWLRLGVKAKTVETIIKYRKKGGKFHSPADIHKIFGLSPKLAIELEPFVKIASLDLTVSKEKAFPAIGNIRSSAKQQIVLINSADSLAWLALIGIGPRLAARIIHFREKLGGFYSIDQVAEVYGLPDSTFESIRSQLQLDPVSLRQLSINEAGREELASHPYIRYELANAIVQYRAGHGLFQTVEELKNLHLITNEIFKKIEPYCKK